MAEAKSKETQLEISAKLEQIDSEDPDECALVYTVKTRGIDYRYRHIYPCRGTRTDWDWMADPTKDGSTNLGESYVTRKDGVVCFGTYSDRGDIIVDTSMTIDADICSEALRASLELLDKKASSPSWWNGHH